jgi:ATP-dependent exoDNAse (exonuclease V) beta subunit
MKYDKHIKAEHDFIQQAEVRFSGTHVIDRELYRAHPAINQSFVKKILSDGLEKARYDMAHPEQATEDMIIGTAHHAILSDIPGAMSDFVVHPKIDRRTKEGKAQWAELMTNAAEGKIMISEESYEKAMSTSASARSAIRLVMPDFKQEHVELSLVSMITLKHDGKTIDMAVKGQIDVVGRREGKLMVLDYKTAQSSQAKKVFHKAIESNWPMQAYLYSAMLADLRREPVEPTYVVTSKEDTTTRLYSFSDSMLSMGKEDFARGIYRMFSQNVSDVEYAGITIL